MKTTTFNALVNYATPTAAKAATVAGDAFLLNETQVWKNGTMAASYNSNKNSSQKTLAALRHKIHYFVRDTSTIGYHPVYDILEADAAANQTKTTTRPGLSSRAATRDDDDRKGYKETDFS